MIEFIDLFFNQYLRIFVGVVLVGTNFIFTILFIYKEMIKFLSN